MVGGRAALTALAVTGSSPSTNSELLVALEADPTSWPHLSAFIADHQTAGRGRAGRDWHTPAGAALTVSFVLRPRLDQDRWGLVPLAVGLAVVRTLRSDGLDAWLKWPNDVVVPWSGGAASGGADAGRGDVDTRQGGADARQGGADAREGAADPGRAPEPHEQSVPGWGPWRKVSGILCERRDDAVVSGVGINVSQSADELPVPHATSLALLGAHTLDRYALLDALSNQVAIAIGEIEADAAAALAQIEKVTATVGTAVVVERPGQAPLTGHAMGLGEDGSLLVRTASGAVEAITAGDVRLRSGS